MAILGAVGGHFRRIACARMLLDNGKNSGELQRLCGIPDYPARKLMDSARRVDKSACGKSIELIIETDYKMKTSYDDSERLLELLVMQLASEARHG